MNKAGGLDFQRGVKKEHLSILGLFHPNGIFRHAATIGTQDLEHPLLFPESSDEQEVDLILWAPSELECQMKGWLEQTASLISNRLAREGLVYVLVPRRWRVKAWRSLKILGFELGPGFLHLPDCSLNRYIIQLDRNAAQYAFTSLFPTRPIIRALALTLLRFPAGEELLGGLLPSVGFVAHRSVNPYLFHWLSRLNDNSQPFSSVILSASWRREQCSLVLHGFGRKAQPLVVAKMARTLPENQNPDTEYRNLIVLGESARTAGARVPYPIKQDIVNGNPVFLQSALDGRSAAAVLKGHPDRLQETLEPIVSWLAAWNRATKVLYLLDGERREQEILAPGRSVAGLLSKGSEYLAWLEQLGHQFQDPVPFIAAHNDLTLWNVLLEPGSPPGIVDWSEASPESLPFDDFFYVLVDAVTVAHRMDRFQAFLACFSPKGRYLALQKQLTARFRHNLGMPEGLTGLCLHACFLHHAMNEQRSMEPGTPSQFLNIVRWLSQNRFVQEGDL